MVNNQRFSKGKSKINKSKPLVSTHKDQAIPHVRLSKILVPSDLFDRLVAEHLEEGRTP